MGQGKKNNSTSKEKITSKNGQDHVLEKQEMGGKTKKCKPTSGSKIVRTLLNNKWGKTKSEDHFNAWKYHLWFYDCISKKQLQ